MGTITIATITCMDTEPPTAPGPGWVPPLPHLAMMWLASPALPVGGFSYSEGLEAAVEAGVATDEPQTLNWVRGQLQLTLARSELPAACAAHAAWEAADSAALQSIPDLGILGNSARLLRDSQIHA